MKTIAVLNWPAMSVDPQLTEPISPDNNAVQPYDIPYPYANGRIAKPTQSLKR